MAPTQTITREDFAAAEAHFIQTCEDRYSNGRRAALSDIEAMEIIAARVAQFAETMKGWTMDLDAARDVQLGVRIQRSAFDVKVVAERFAEVLASELLSDEAAAVFMAQVRRAP